ncbi:TetR family transcriptional regulator [Sphingopyxis sp. Root1497]|uniref:TetR/AcrR family transcriptional regulator n=1 Tax=unclassified Sphingopyxis TaxID=2614943 RepID=UPI0006FA48D2|nr:MULTISPECIES: TetR family transcriptional regulator [unclassified Sphingopyxis]KQZ65041.1 TetR family transcriptional regulator [Sphingopyxis sp. Root1497]OHD01072.1 MAG: TetR family transcriptional regulator [Sphingopyxis sp. RIFCSPHIGHO2_01_FULL_65_24]
MVAKKRLSPEESRSAALEAARTILIEMGPAAVTLKAVAARIDRTHANLLHHFGSAAGLQKALAAYQAETVCATIGRKMAESPPGERNVREIVDLAFDAFNEGGAGALATWMAATGNEDALDPIVEAIHRLIDNIAPDAHEKRLMHEDTLALVLMALGDAQLGGPMAEALDLPRDTSRVLATELITGRIAKFWAEHGGKPAA